MFILLSRTLPKKNLVALSFEKTKLRVFVVRHIDTHLNLFRHHHHNKGNDDTDNEVRLIFDQDEVKFIIHRSYTFASSLHQLLAYSFTMDGPR